MTTAVEAVDKAADQVRGRRDWAFSQQYINGAWRPGGTGRTIADTDPYSKDTLTEISLADRRDVEDAYQAASKAQLAWAKALPAQRAAVLLRCAALIEERRADIVDWLVREAGSTRIKAELEAQWTHAVTVESASFCHRVAGNILPIDIAGKESRVYRQPVGVVGVISPWNFPLYLSQRAVAPAIALGNAVVLKPAQDTPVAGGLLLAKLFEESGLPGGVLNVIVGASGEVGDAFVQHPAARVIAFTGSTEVGRRVAKLAAESPIIKRVALELGGNSPLVVLDDADLDVAVPAAIFSRYFHQGQICMSSNRIIVDTSVYDEFVERFAQHAARLKFGDPKEADTVVGPVINERQLQRMVGYIEESRAAGARQVLGGPPGGLVLPPHVFSGVANEMPIAKHETFGPVAAIISVSGEAHALNVANNTEYGLSSAVFTRDEARGLRFAKSLQVGMTHVNDTTVNDSPNSPFGGEKNSGLGRYGGEWIMREFTTEHWITVQHKPRRYPF